MTADIPDLAVALADTPELVTAALRLRYRVFVTELGGGGAGVDHDAGIERDSFDDVVDHLCLIDRNRPAGHNVVGVYRLLRSDVADRTGGFYTDAEYDLSVLRAGGRRLLELGRSCLDPDYRGGTAMFRMWHGLGAYVRDHDIDILFGTASFHGTDPAAIAQSLSVLWHDHLAPPPLRVRSRIYQDMNLLPADRIDRRVAMLGTPALIKAYLRLGGHVGDGAFVDHDFNTIDVCLVMDTERMNAATRDLYLKGRDL